MNRAMKYLPIVTLIAANLIPIAGVLFWGWSLIALLILYWLESLVVGAVNVLRIITCNGPIGQRIRTSLFFTVHYGSFWLAHGLFLMLMLIPEIKKYSTDEGYGGLSVSGIMIAMLGFLISHIVAFISYNSRFPRAERRPPLLQMFAPYGRVFVLHIVILGGAYLAAKYASVFVVVLLFAVLKLLAELGAGFIMKQSTVVAALSKRGDVA